METILKNKKIYKYNITYQEQKNLFFKFVDNRVSSETKNINLFLILFEKDHKISKFSISDGCSVNKIDQMIDLCLQNACAGELKRMSSVEESNNFKLLYDKFNSSNYITWLKNELNLLLENLDFCFNFVYTIEISKIFSKLYARCNTAYKYSSTCGIMDVEDFSHNAFINDCFINDNLSSLLISEIGNFKKIKL